MEEVSYTSPPPYSIAIDIIRQMHHRQKFPLLKSRDIYQHIFHKCVPIIEDNYPLFKWKSIWKRVNNTFIGISEREFLFRCLHETLATNQRLQMLKIRDNGNCDKCGEVEYSLHIFYFCKNIQCVVKWFQNILIKLGNMSSSQFLRTLMLDFKASDRKYDNMITLLISDYLYVLWLSKKKEYNTDQTLNFLKNKFNYSRWITKCLLKDNMNAYFPNAYVNYIF